MASILYHHRIYCLTEGAWTYLWKEDDSLITTCPTDPAHSVQAGSAAVINEVSTGIVQINQQPGFQTGTSVRVDHVILDAPAAGSAEVTVDWPMDVAIYTIHAAVAASCVGCTLTIEAAPRTAIGTLTADAPIGSTVLNVTPTAVANASLGHIITLQMGGTVQELGRTTAIDAALNTITVETATTSNFLAATPTAVQLTRRAADNIELAIEGALAFGESRARAVNFPKGRALRAALTNPNGAPAHLVMYLSYNY